jgi:hypothetical protein
MTLIATACSGSTARPASASVASCAARSAAKWRSPASRTPPSPGRGARRHAGTPSFSTAPWPRPSARSPSRRWRTGWASVCNPSGSGERPWAWARRRRERLSCEAITRRSRGPSRALQPLGEGRRSGAAREDRQREAREGPTAPRHLGHAGRPHWQTPERRDAAEDERGTPGAEDPAAQRRPSVGAGGSSLARHDAGRGGGELHCGRYPLCGPGVPCWASRSSPGSHAVDHPGSAHRTAARWPASPAPPTLPRGRRA